MELAAAIGVSRQTIYNWQKIDGCPSARTNGNYKVEEWAAFGAEVSAKCLDAPNASEKAQLEARKLKVQCERLEFQFACERGEWTPNEIIATEILRLVSETRMILQEELDTKAPPKIREFNRRALDRAMTRLHKGSSEAFALPA